MRRALPSAALLLLVGASALRAEDFSGFYAGVNAGYAVSGGHETHHGPVAPGMNRASEAGGDLPPSAAGAAKLMQDRKQRNRSIAD